MNYINTIIKYFCILFYFSNVYFILSNENIVLWFES